MKNLLIISLLLAAIMLPLGGCVSSGGGNDWRQNVPQLKADAFMFSKLATRVALSEANMPVADKAVIEGYLVALRDLLAVPGHPDFTGARLLVDRKLPPKYKVYGLTIIDVLERYLSTANLDITDDQELIIGIISSGINGAIEAVREIAE